LDAVVGLRSIVALSKSKKIFFIGRFDVGGGGSKFTYQLFGGLGYDINKTIALVGGYRALDVKYDKNNFLYDTNQRGPIVGIGFKF
jgi:opacity protein-like surface antigen